MKLKNVIAAAVIGMSALSASASDVLTNQSVIEMIDLGFDTEIIIAKINESECNFNTDVEALKAMKEAGADKLIILAMMNRKAELNDEKEVAEEVSTTRPTGIYYVLGDEEIRILPTVFSGKKSNPLAASLTYGIVSTKTKSTLLNAEASVKIRQVLPKFIFRFSPESVEQNAQKFVNDWWFVSASSPNEFALVKLKSNKKKNYREITTGSSNAYTGDRVGIDQKSSIPFDIEVINDYTFAVIPKKGLEPGEYCFFYSGAIPSMYTNQSVFDFSVAETE